MEKEIKDNSNTEAAVNTEALAQAAKPQGIEYEALGIPTEAPAQEKKRKKDSKDSGSFRIPNKALDILIDCKATAWQIGAYLTLARYTESTGKFTTASNKAICKNTGASSGSAKRPGKARELVQWLTEKKLIYTPEAWHNKTKEKIPEIPHKLYPITFVLDDFKSKDTEWVWFPNTLVDGHGKFTQPLKRLKQCGDIVARTLLLMYSMDDMEQYGGVSPVKAVYKSYEMQHHATTHDFAFWEADAQASLAWEFFYIPALGLKVFSENKKKQEEEIKPFWDALRTLESRGFIYEVVTVMDGEANSQDARPIYELKIRARHGETNPAEQGFADRINKIFENIGITGIADAAGRFNGKYPVLSRAGIKPYVTGIYRLRFRVSNPKNYSVGDSWKRIGKDQRDMLEEIEQLEKMLGMTAQKAENV